MAVHCREEGCIGLYIPDGEEISYGPRDISRAEGNLEVGGDGEDKDKDKDNDKEKDKIIKRQNMCYTFEKQGVQGF